MYLNYSSCAAWCTIKVSLNLHHLNYRIDFLYSPKILVDLAVQSLFLLVCVPNVAEDCRLAIVSSAKHAPVSGNF